MKRKKSQYRDSTDSIVMFPWSFSEKPPNDRDNYAYTFIRTSILKTLEIKNHSLKFYGKISKEHRGTPCSLFEEQFRNNIKNEKAQIGEILQTPNLG